MPKKIFLYLFFLSIGVCMNAQQDLTMYYMKNIPQFQYANPAFRPMGRVNVGLPGSSIYFNHVNTILTPKNLFDVSGERPVLDVAGFQSKIKDLNYIGFNSQLDLLSFGLRVKNSYLSFNITEQVMLRFTLPKSFLMFPFTGNANFDMLDNGTLDFSGFGLEFNHYREYGFGYQRTINEKWSVGAKLKLLYGMENISTTNSNMMLHTDTVEYNWTITGDVSLNTSGIGTLLDSIPDNNALEAGYYSTYLFGKQNGGVGLSGGVTYQLNDKINLNASFVDLGFIKWRVENGNVKTDNENFIFNGVDLTSMVFLNDSDREDTLDVVIENLKGDFNSAFHATKDQFAYKTSLFTRLYIGGTYLIYKSYENSGTAGFLLQGEFYKGKLRPSLTVSYNQRLRDFINFSAAFNMVNRDKSAIGLGASMNIGPFQLYLVMDNVMMFNLASFTNERSGGGFVYPFNASTMQFRTGFNLTFARNTDRDEDGIVNRKDKCPDIYGVEEFEGCPDTDGDKVPDNKDACPKQAGEAKFDGCPDTDQDGVTDLDDHCPDVKGLIKFHGCPDTDGDSFPDDIDACPEIAGVAKKNGCPEEIDSDGDGVMDYEDKCPDLKGDKAYKGCPDTDGDLIFDHLDRCPNVPGPVENRGCPWGDTDDDGIRDDVDKCPYEYGLKENDGCPTFDFDKDGIPDIKDHCPKTRGPATNNGCPLIEKKEQAVINTAFSNLEFVLGKSVIIEGSKASLKELAELLIAKSDWKLEVAGHTDNQGSETLNMELSKERAQAVVDILVGYGVPKDRFIVKYFGQSKPIATNENEEGRQKNRRVEMTVKFD